MLLFICMHYTNGNILQPSRILSEIFFLKGVCLFLALCIHPVKSFVSQSVYINFSSLVLTLYQNMVKLRLMIDIQLWVMRN